MPGAPKAGGDGDAKTFWLTPVLGAISGVTADVVTHPAATVKTRIQVQGASGSSGGAQVLRYSNPIKAAQQMLVNEGGRSFFKGVGAVAAGSPLGSALYFAGLEGTKATLGADGFSAGFLSGCLGQLCGSLGWVPMDVIKERCMIEGQVKTTNVYGSSYKMLFGIVKTEGPFGLYRAFWIHQATWVPFNGMYWGVYDYIKKYQQTPDGKATFGDGAFAFTARATAAGIAASIATSPIDLVKTRMQVARANPELFGYNNSLDCARKVLATEGFKAFFDGLTPRIIWLTPHRMIMIATYEFLWRKFSDSED